MNVGGGLQTAAQAVDTIKDAFLKFKHSRSEPEQEAWELKFFERVELLEKSIHMLAGGAPVLPSQRAKDGARITKASRTGAIHGDSELNFERTEASIRKAADDLRSLSTR